MIKVNFVLSIIIIALNLSMASANQDVDLKTKESITLHVRAVELDYCKAKIDVLKKSHQQLVADISILNKCTLDYMSNDAKTSECYQAGLKLKDTISSFMTTIDICGDSSLDAKTLSATIALQKNKVVELIALIGRNYKVLAVKKIAAFQKEVSIEISKNIEKMDCDIAIITNVKLMNEKYPLVLAGASMDGDYHKMKQAMSAILALKSRLGLLVKKCNDNENRDYIVRAHKRVEERIKFFEKANLQILVELACKNVLPLNPGAEVVALCEKKVVSDYFFSILSEILSKQQSR